MAAMMANRKAEGRPLRMFHVYTSPQIHVHARRVTRTNRKAF